MCPGQMAQPQYGCFRVPGRQTRIEGEEQGKGAAEACCCTSACLGDARKSVAPRTLLCTSFMPKQKDAQIGLQGRVIY